MSSLNRAIRDLEQAESKIAELEQRCFEPIAIIGLGCRFPGGKNPQHFWESLEAGVDSVAELSARRWAAPAGTRADRPLYAALLDEEDVYGFDAGFFGVSAGEAAAIDPQQRLFLQVAVEALEDAGIPLERARGAKAGAFVGMMTLDYQCLSMSRSIAALDIHTATGIGPCFASGRVSHLLGFEGPSVSMDTACSSSLVALHLACQSLRARECDVAVAGGVNLILSPHTMQLYAALQTLSPDGHCYTFDERANGLVRGEGCGVVVCKRLSDALRQGDDIRAVIRGTAVNHNGRSSGLVAPSVMAQRALLGQALAAAGLGGDALDYIEVHGIGTALGDAIEIEALKAVVGCGREDGAACKLGSLKPNVGHLEAASGIAGVIKAILALEHERIPRQIHLVEQSSRISLQGSSLEICREGAEWKRGARVRRAGVSALGLSGTNAHVVLQEAPRREGESAGTDAESVQSATEAAAAMVPVVVLAARSEASLRAQAARSLAMVERREAKDGDGRWLRDLAYTTTQRRTHHPHRLAMIARSEVELAAQLREWLDGGMPEGVRAGRAAAGGARVVLAFGEGEGWRGRRPAPLGALIARVRSLMAGHGEREEEERELAALERGAGGVGSTGMTAAGERGATSEAAELGQLGRLLWMLALAEELAAAGVEAEVALGDGVGAVAAACAGGELSLEEAVAAVRRGATRTAGRWGEALGAAVGEGAAVVVTVGGGAEMQAALCALRGPRLHVAPWLDRGAAMAEALAQVQAAVFAAGGAVRWTCGETARLLRLPGYAWQLDAHRIELPPTGGVGTLPGAANGPGLSTADAGFSAEVRRELSPLLVQRWGVRASSLERVRGGGELRGRWLVVTDAASAGRGGQLAALIGAAGGVAQAAHVEDEEDEVAGALASALEEAFGEADGRGVIFFEAAGALAEGGEPHLAVERAVWRLSRLVAALAARKWRRAAPRLWLVTEEDVRAPGSGGDAGAAAAMAGAALWAAGRTIALEHPALGCTRVGVERGAALESLLEVLGEDDEARGARDEELARRGGEWQVGRLERLPGAALSAELEEERAVVRTGERALRLELDRPGIFEEVTAAFGGGVLAPLPTKVRPAAEVVEAFAEMAGGRHQGKLVVRIADEAIALDAVRREEGSPRAVLPICEVEASYLITGGMEGGRRLGSLVDWLVAQGARKVVWLDRVGLGRGVEAQALALEALGVELVVCEGDVAELDCVREAVGAAESMGPLRGVIHAAAPAERAGGVAKGAIDASGVIDASGAERAGLSGWILAKVAGAWNLHLATKGRALRWFALFSSAGAQLGAPGRAAMAAADGALDGLARHRRARGLPALSVQWGEIAEEGAASEAGEGAGDRDRVVSLGAVSHLAPERAWRWLGQALGASRAELCVIELRPRQLLEVFPQLAASSRFAALLAEGAAANLAGEREPLEEI